MTPHPARPRHALAEVDALIDRSALPDEHRALVRQVVRRARLPAAASADVAEEQHGEEHAGQAAAAAGKSDAADEDRGERGQFEIDDELGRSGAVEAA